MCGIFGYVGHQDAGPVIVGGLKRLEYRGYDSAGVAVINGTKSIHLSKKKGKVHELEGVLKSQTVTSSIGIGHTRWATHGAPSDENSHPHLDQTGRIALIHNGIIENFMEIKESLISKGHTFLSSTDSEVLAHLVGVYYEETKDLIASVRKAVAEAQGAYAIGVLCCDDPDTIIAARSDSPLVIGIGEGENFLASDISAFLNHTKKMLSVENGEIVKITKDTIELTDSHGKVIDRKIEEVTWDIEAAEKQGYDHFMLKEIMEQPDIVENLLNKRCKDNRVRFEELKLTRDDLKDIKTILIIACGSSYHAGLVAKYAMEELVAVNVQVELSSEFRYRKPRLDASTLVVPISQSGETADTLAGLREAKKLGAKTMAICNVLGSTIERESDGVLYTHAGPEIAVASTKAYTAQMVVLYLFGLYLKELQEGPKALDEIKEFLDRMREVPSAMREFINVYNADREEWDENVRRFKERHDEQLSKYISKDKGGTVRAPNAFFLYIARNINFPSVLEGALKLKEIAYISAEGYAAGEMKHGPIALIDEYPWVICIAVESATYEKMVSNILEIKARGGMVTAIVSKGDKKIRDLDLYLYIEVPRVSEVLSPFVVALPLQLIAYSVACAYGTEIDQPRNLAKSVTVE